MKRPEPIELLMDVLREGCAPNFNVILSSNQGAFQMRYEPQPELVRLLQANQDRFIELLKEPVIIAADWGFGAKFATFRVIELEPSGDKPFVTFTLPIPLAKPYAVMPVNK